MEVNNSKNDKGLIIVLVIMIVVILGLVLYIMYDKGILLSSSKEEVLVKEKGNSNNKEEEDVDINSDIVQNLYNIFRVDTWGLSVDGLNNDNLTRLFLAYKNIPVNDSLTIECSKLDANDNLFCGNDDSSEMANALINGDMVKFREYEKQHFTNYVDANFLHAKVHMLFGSDYKITPQSFETDCSHTMIYNKNQNVYALYHSNTGCMSATEPQELLSASKKGDELYIKTAVKDLNNGNVVSNIDYTFEKDQKNGNYVFVKAVEEKK